MPSRMTDTSKLVPPMSIADEVVDPEHTADAHTRGASARRPREQKPDRLARGGASAAHAAVRLHEQEMGGETLGVDAPRELIDVTCHHRHQQRVEDRGGRALIFADLRAQFARTTDFQGRKSPREVLGHVHLMLGIEIGIEQADGYRRGVQPIDAANELIDGLLGQTARPRCHRPECARRYPIGGHGGSAPGAPSD